MKQINQLITNIVPTRDSIELGLSLYKKLNTLANLANSMTLTPREKVSILALTGKTNNVSLALQLNEQLILTNHTWLQNKSNTRAELQSHCQAFYRLLKLYE